MLTLEGNLQHALPLSGLCLHLQPPFNLCPLHFLHSIYTDLLLVLGNVHVPSGHRAFVHTALCSLSDSLFSLVQPELDLAFKFPLK